MWLIRQQLAGFLNNESCPGRPQSSLRKTTGLSFFNEGKIQMEITSSFPCNLVRRQGILSRNMKNTICIFFKNQHDSICKIFYKYGRTYLVIYHLDRLTFFKFILDPCEDVLSLSILPVSYNQDCPYNCPVKRRFHNGFFCCPFGTPIIIDRIRIVLLSINTLLAIKDKLRRNENDPGIDFP